MYTSLSLSLYIYIYIHRDMYVAGLAGDRHDLPANIIHTRIARLELSGKFPLGLGIPPLKSR